MGGVQWMQPPVCRRALGPSSLCLKKELGRSLTFRKLPFLAEPQPSPGKTTNPNKELSVQPGGGNGFLSDGKYAGKGQLYWGCLAVRRHTYSCLGGTGNLGTCPPPPRPSRCFQKQV